MRPHTELMHQMIALVNSYQRNGAALAYADISAAGINMRSGQYWLNRMVDLGLIQRLKPGLHIIPHPVRLEDVAASKRPDRLTDLHDPEHDAWLAMVKQQRAQRQTRIALERIQAIRQAGAH